MFRTRHRFDGQVKPEVVLVRVPLPHLHREKAAISVAPEAMGPHIRIPALDRCVVTHGNDHPATGLQGSMKAGKGSPDFRIRKQVGHAVVAGDHGSRRCRLRVGECPHVVDAHFRLQGAAFQLRPEARDGAGRQIGGDDAVALAQQSQRLGADTTGGIEYDVAAHDTQFPKQVRQGEALARNSVVPVRIKQWIKRRQFVVEGSRLGFAHDSVWRAARMEVMATVPHGRWRAAGDGCHNPGDRKSQLPRALCAGARAGLRFLSRREREALVVRAAAARFRSWRACAARPGNLAGRPRRRHAPSVRAGTPAPRSAPWTCRRV